MKNNETLRENINWLINRYREELKIEKQKDILEQDLEIINCYENIIIELEYALKVSI